jgi:glycosyltransferase involved in cell wall biosynthesis
MFILGFATGNRTQLHIYYINYLKFEGSSGIHIHFLANELVKMGVKCTVCLPHSADSVQTCGDVLYRSVTFRELKKQVSRFPQAFAEQGAIFHAWTPREVVRRFCSKVVSRLKRPYFLHLEDNEEVIFESHLGRTLEQAAKLSWLRKVLLPRAFIHPDHYQSFLAGAAGVTCIMESLEAFTPPQVPTLTFWPACEELFFALAPEPDQAVRRELGIEPDAIVMTYTGNVHRANIAEVSTLYEAVKVLNDSGHCTVLIRCGSDHGELSEQAQAATPFVRALGNVVPANLDKYIAAADILVQPGCDDKFNRFRFPSKLPMYLASGRPVVLPDSNIGKQMRGGENCVLLHSGDTAELVAQLKRLIEKPVMAAQIGAAGRTFAQENFNWRKSAESVLAFYEEHAGGA